MADNEKLGYELEGQYADDKSIARLWQRIKGAFVGKDGDKVLSDNNFSDADKEKLDSIEEGANKYELPIASADTLGGMKPGAGLLIDADGTVNVESAGRVEWENVENTPDTLEGYGITDAATKEELEEVAQKVSRIYVPKGSVDTYADLENIENPEYGWVYNVREDGKNYAWCEGDAGEPDFWDDLGGTFEIKPLTPHDIDIITGYATDEEVFDAIIEDGGEIELAEDMELSGMKMITKEVVIDLAGYTLTSAVTASEKLPMFAVNGPNAKLTLKNGSAEAEYNLASAYNGAQIVVESGVYDAGYIGFTASGEGSKVTYNDGELYAVEGGIGAFYGANIEVNGGSIVVSDNFAVFTNGKEGLGKNHIVVNGGTLVGNIVSAGYEACGVYIANDDTFTMNGGEIIADNGAGLCMRGGTVVINDGMILSTGESGTKGKIADCKILMGKSAVIYHESADYPGKAGMSLTINGGVFTGVDHSVEVLSNEAEPKVYATGGTFSPDYPEQ